LTTFNNLEEGDHILYVLDENGCAHQYDFTIGVYAEPEFSYDTYDSCTGHYLGALFITTSDLTLDFSLNGIDYSDQTDFLDLEEGDYTLYVETGDNCVFTYPFTIGSIGLLLVDLDLKPSCEGLDNGEVNVMNAQGLELSLDGINYEAVEGITDLAAGDYFIHVQNEEQCPVTIPFTIEEIEQAELVFTEPVIDCLTKEVNLEVLNLNQVDVNISWNNGETGDFLVVDQSGEYEVMIESECETRSYKWDIQFERDRQFGKPVFIPNIFTPDSQDLNSEFRPLINEAVELIEYKLSIYDRWGNKVFTSSDNQDFWDGFHNDKEAAPGVFVWHIEMSYTKCDQASTFENFGDVTLIR